MSSTACVLLSAAVLVLAGVRQSLGAPTDPQDDPAYQLFKMNIESQKVEAEYKLNSSREIFVNNTKTFNLHEFDEINATLYDCFEVAVQNNPSADKFCVEFIEQDVMQVISDSKNELEACSNLTHSWELIGDLLKEAEEAISALDVVVDKILAQALACVTRYPYSAAMKNNCFNTAKAFNNNQLNNAVSLAQDAYFNISGGGLLLGAEVSSCQKAESFSFKDKCGAIVSELVINCVSTKSSTTSA